MQKLPECDGVHYSFKCLFVKEIHALENTFFVHLLHTAIPAGDAVLRK